MTRDMGLAKPPNKTLRRRYTKPELQAKKKKSTPSIQKEYSDDELSSYDLSSLNGSPSSIFFLHYFI